MELQHVPFGPALLHLRVRTLQAQDLPTLHRQGINKVCITKILLATLEASLRRSARGREATKSMGVGRELITPQFRHVSTFKKKSGFIIAEVLTRHNRKIDDASASVRARSTAPSRDGLHRDHEPGTRQFDPQPCRQPHLACLSLVDISRSSFPERVPFPDIKYHFSTAFGPLE